MTSEYVHTNIDEIEDLAPKYGMDFGEARIIHQAVGSEQVGASFYRLEPGKRFGFGHHHKKAQEIYLVIAGTGRARLGDEIRELHPFDVVYCEPQLMREFEGGEDGMTLLAIGSHIQGDAEMQPGWWTD